MIFVIALAAIMTTSCDPPIEPTRRVVYKTLDGVELEALIFAPTDHTPSDNRPAMVFFHGGGWINGNPESMARQARHLAERGMVAISVEYRIESTHGTTPFESIADAFSAIRWARAHADELGIDPERIGGGGGSAGGHLAAAVATITAKGYDRDEDRTVDPRPDALVLFNPVYDNGPNGYGHERIGDRYVDVSPLHNIHIDMPPTLVMLGDRDDLVPVSTAEAFRDRMRELGARSELVIYPGMEHAFYSGPGFEPTLATMDGFLVSLGWLSATTQE